MESDVMTAQDYLPYGMPIYDKLYKATSTSYYKFAFNGKEKDDETKGAYNSYDYGYRMYDPRICRFLSVDPLTKQFPHYSPYQFAGNTPIQAIDMDGLEEWKVNGGGTVNGPYSNRDQAEKAALEGNATIHLPPIEVIDFKSHNTSNTNISNKALERVDNIADRLDPFIGLTLNKIKNSLNKKLLYHSFTLDEGFENSIKRVSSVKTPFGSVKATSMFKAGKVLGKASGVANLISVANYTNEIFYGNEAKGYTGLTVMTAGMVIMAICPPCALGAIVGSATYSLYLEDKIFDQPKKSP
ncbi:MAG: RHS repeat-associated core domain-containing protein [Saprospiraceae bacterium]|nr:RHS repeat-associated core domain-containing protein [Saprospiraceae bacterium]